MSHRYVPLIGVFMVVAVLAVACVPKAVTPAPEVELQLTLDELKQFDGREGRPAYVAIDGVVYDVSGVRAWSGGRHQGNVAGHDLTDALKNRSPHGTRVLSNLKVVGRLK